MLFHERDRSFAYLDDYNIINTEKYDNLYIMDFSDDSILCIVLSLEANVF